MVFFFVDLDFFILNILSSIHFFISNILWIYYLYHLMRLPSESSPFNDIEYHLMRLLFNDIEYFISDHDIEYGIFDI